MPPPPEPEPAFRLFRRAAYGIHATVATAFCLLVTWNVVRSVRAMSPEMPPPVATPSAVADCVQRAARLWSSLEERRRSLGSFDVTVRDAHASWTEFRLGWLRRLRADQAECGVDRSDRERLRRVFFDLERLEDLYSTLAVQYAGGIQPSVERFHADLDAAAGISGVTP